MRWLFEALAPAGDRGRLSVFIFHRVLPEPDPLFPGDPDASRFESQMRWISEWFNVLPLGEAIQRLAAADLPSRAAAITFDDGYADNCTIALPILKRLGLSATFFIATGFLDGGRMWNDTVIEAIRRAAVPRIDLPSLELEGIDVETLEAKRAAIARVLSRLKYLPPEARQGAAAAVEDAAQARLPVDLMLTHGQVRTLAASGMTVGAHTVSHPILASLGDEHARAEIQEGKEQLEVMVGNPVSLFAYPNGKPGRDYTAVHAKLVRESGFAAAFSTSRGVATAGSDLYQLPRFTPWDQSSWRYAMRLVGNLRNDEPAVA